MSVMRTGLYFLCLRFLKCLTKHWILEVEFISVFVIIKLSFGFIMYEIFEFTVDF